MQYLLLAAFSLVSVFTLGLAIVNRRYQERRAGQVPAELQSTLDEATLEKAARYGRDRGRFGLVHALISKALVAAFFFGGGLGVFDAAVARLELSFVATGVAFALGLAALSALIELPFAAYRTFVLEQKHGFNRMSVGLFVSDALKAALIGALFVAGLTAAALAIFAGFPKVYWLVIWGALLAFNVTVTLIAPYVIEPLFFKTSELSTPELADRIQKLARQAGVRVSRVLKMDASRRSSHSNAYFTGLGPVKRVVLFDTLLERMNSEEILGVLAHELGHWKKGHVPQRFVLGQLGSLLGLAVFSWVLPWSGLPQWVFLEQASVPARALIAGFAWSVFGFPLTPLASAWSRRHEREADRFASDLTRAPGALASALAKLARDNLASLFYHPWFEKMYATHPNVVERIQTLAKVR